MKQIFDNNRFRDFEYIPRFCAWARAKMFQTYLNDQTTKGQLNYRLVTSSGCGPVIEMGGQKMISLVSNDYLGFTQHSAVKQAAIDGIMKYGSGAGASPAIGGHSTTTSYWKEDRRVFPQRTCYHLYHRLCFEQRIAAMHPDQR